MIEEAQIVFHKADEPDFIAHLLDPDVLAGEDGTEIDLAPTDANATALRNGDGAVVERILKVTPIRGRGAVSVGRAQRDISC